MLGAVPVPVSATLEGLFAPLCVIERLADFTPVVPGVNVTLIVQVALEARALAQLFVCAN